MVHNGKVARFIFVEWLLIWLRETVVFHFEWDHGNRDKNFAKHKIPIADIEELFTFGLAIPLGIQVSPPVKEQRIALTGPISTGQHLTVVFTLRGGRVRAISARPAHRKEREAYEKIIRKIAERV